MSLARETDYLCCIAGYGATTLPALTEAITLENNATLAVYEAERLKVAIDNMKTALAG